MGELNLEAMCQRIVEIRAMHWLEVGRRAGAVTGEEMGDAGGKIIIWITTEVLAAAAEQPAEAGGEEG